MSRAFTVVVALSLVAVASAGCAGKDSNAVAGAASCDGISKGNLTLSNPSHSVFLLATGKGCIVAEAYDDKAPITVANFRTYANESFFDNTIFHRVRSSFVIQAGAVGADGEFKEGSHPTIKNEAQTSGLKNLQYTFSMARGTPPDSASTSFFINLEDNAGLDPGGQGPGSAGYAVFAIVIQGQDVVESIEGIATTDASAHPYCLSIDDQGVGRGSCPVEPVVMHSAKVI